MPEKPVRIKYIELQKWSYITSTVLNGTGFLCDLYNFITVL